MIIGYNEFIFDREEIKLATIHSAIASIRYKDSSNKERVKEIGTIHPTPIYIGGSETRQVKVTLKVELI